MKTKEQILAKYYGMDEKDILKFKDQTIPATYPQILELMEMSRVDGFSEGWAEACKMRDEEVDF